VRPHAVHPHGVHVGSLAARPDVYVAAVLGGQLLKHVAGGSQPMMLFIAGVLLLLAALSVPTIKNSKA